MLIGSNCLSTTSTPIMANLDPHVHGNAMRSRTVSKRPGGMLRTCFIKPQYPLYHQQTTIPLSRFGASTPPGQTPPPNPPQNLFCRCFATAANIGTHQKACFHGMESTPLIKFSHHLGLGDEGEGGAKCRRLLQPYRPPDSVRLQALKLPGHHRQHPMQI